MAEQKTEFEVFKDGEYFRGTIKQGDLLTSKGPVYFITCLSCAGGTVCTGFMDYRHKKKGELIGRIKAYAKRHKMRFRKLKPDTHANND